MAYRFIELCKHLHQDEAVIYEGEIVKDRGSFMLQHMSH